MADEALMKGAVKSCRKLCYDLYELFYPPPEQKDEAVKICSLCFEDGALKRKCCNRMFCDHCYTKDRKCPYCSKSTRQEKLTGATFAVEDPSEVEECRCCLELGIKRKCCGSYYCDDCFYKVPLCRFCDAPVVKEDTRSRGFATILSVIISWLATIFFILIVAAFGVLMSYNESQTKILLSGYKCYGLFKDCTVWTCAEVPDNVATGVAPLTPLVDWQPCTLESTTKIHSLACIFDPQLYFATTVQTPRANPKTLESVGVMGYDLCVEKFENGVYIFEDMFEAWTNVSYKSNMMKSARWKNIVNGISTPYCGVGNIEGGKNALVFSGEGNRYAMTVDMDLSSGGSLEAELFIAPIGFDVQYPFCKSSYSGGVYVMYSVDAGDSWEILHDYPAYFYRSASFFPVKFDFPVGEHPAAAPQVRFRFEQRSFTPARDQWALDNVRVLRHLPTSSSNTDEWLSLFYAKSVGRTLDWMQRAQCCFDTDWCQTRLSAQQMDDCKNDFAIYYQGRHYLLRGAELYVMIIVLINLIKFFYLGFAEWYLRKRYPFQSEWEDLTKLDRLFKYLPARYRPKKSLESFVGNVHLSARMGSELMDGLRDDEGQGEAKMTKEDEERLKREDEERIKREKKLLKQRMKSKKFQGSSLGTGKGKVVPTSSSGLSKDDDDDEEDEEARMDREEAEEEAKALDAVVSNGGEGGGGGETALDKFKKQNVGMLRQPFDTRIDQRWLDFFRNYNLGLLALFTLIKIGTTSDYTVHQPLLVFGRFPGDFSLTSLGVFFFAFCCDLKEIYYTLKMVVPARPEWVPMITVDLQEDVSALFIGEHIISIKDIGEMVTFPPAFALLSALGYFIGCFPWCLFAIILRDQFLQFISMRIVTPALAIIGLLRAILGPSFVIKIAFSFYYLFALDPKQRERAGVACQAMKTRYSAATGAFYFAIFVWIVSGVVAADQANLFLGFGFVAGLFYGAFTGCVHGLPIRPWMVLTCLRGGVWMRVKKKQRCPCIYWGSFCTDMHDAEEVFLIYTTDDVRFLGTIKGGVASASG